VARRRRIGELEFETALVGALEDGHGLRVRAERDQVDRRRRGYANLSFDYAYESPQGSNALVTVRMVELEDITQQFRVDLSDRDAIEAAVADAEPLALAIHTRLEDEKGEGPLPWDD
jgi:hypothetical protein